MMTPIDRTVGYWRLVDMQGTHSAGPGTPSPQRKKGIPPFNFLEAFPLTLLLKEITTVVISSL